MIPKLLNLNPLKHLKNAAGWSKLPVSIYSSAHASPAKRIVDLFGDVDTGVRLYDSNAKKLPVDASHSSYFKFLIRTSQGPEVDTGDTGEARRVILGLECQRLPKEIGSVVNPSRLPVHDHLMNKARSVFQVRQVRQIVRNPYVHHPGWLHEYSHRAVQLRDRALYNKLTQSNLITTHIDASPSKGDHRLLFVIHRHLIRYYGPTEMASYSPMVKNIKQNHYTNVKPFEDALKADIDN